jgi:hypothetical protein
MHVSRSRIHIDVIYALFDISASAAIAKATTTTYHEPMSNPNPTSPRPTLKLKVAPRVASSKSTSMTAQPPSPPKMKPGAQWSDEYKQRMQADMDALSSR